MKIVNIFPIFLIALIVACSSETTDELWYKQPAANWNEALPLGNGRIGALVFGQTNVERIQLNDDSLWPGDDGWDNGAGRLARAIGVKRAQCDNRQVIRKIKAFGKLVGANFACRALGFVVLTQTRIAAQRLSSW